MFLTFAHIVFRLGEKLSELSAQLFKRKRLLSRKSFVNWMLLVSNVRVLPLCWEAEVAALLILQRMIEYSTRFIFTSLLSIAAGFKTVDTLHQT